MIFGKVAGTVVSTRKSDSITGTKYLLVRLCSQDEKLSNSYLVVLDLVGAGIGEMVIVSQGSSARQSELTYQKPIDAVIVGIVDLVEEKGIMKLVKATYEKYDEVSSFEVPEGGKGMHWAHPVVCGGRLYIRIGTARIYQGRALCARGCAGLP